MASERVVSRTAVHVGTPWAKAFEAIDDECVRQIEIERFDAEHDDAHVADGWIVLLARYVGRVGDATGHADPEEYRHRLVQVAALAAKAVASLDRALAQPTGIDEPIDIEIPNPPYEYRGERS